MLKKINTIFSSYVNYIILISSATSLHYEKCDEVYYTFIYLFCYVLCIVDIHETFTFKNQIWREYKALLAHGQSTRLSVLFPMWLLYIF